MSIAEGLGDRLYVFDSNGRLIKRFGAHGEGPGELSTGRVMAITPGDTLHVFDEDHGRHSVFDPDYRFIRSSPSPREISGVIFRPDGSYMVSAVVNDPNRIGLLYHHFHVNGNYLRSFGDSGTLISRKSITQHVRRIAPSAGGGFWSAPFTHKYRLEFWSWRYGLTRVIEPTVDWYHPYEKVLAPTPHRAPLPSMWGLWEDRTGLVWTTSSVGATNYATGLGPPQQMEGQQVYLITDQHAVWDGMLEVFSPADGQLVARLQTRDPFQYVLGPGLLAGIRWDEDGTAFLEIASVVLRRPPQ